MAAKTKEKMILVNSSELTLSDFVEDGTTKRGLFYRGMRVTTAGCPSLAKDSGRRTVLTEFYLRSGKEWVRPIPPKKGEAHAIERASEPDEMWDERFPE